MNLKTVFDAVYVVNLNRRLDRWQKFLAQVPTDWPFVDPIRVPACDGHNVPHPDWWRAGGGAWGCYRSHLRLLEDALNNDTQSILLLEDDALFPDGFTERVTQFFEYLPANWGMIYLGGQHLFAKQQPPVRINEYVYQPYNVNRTHAFAVRGPMRQVVYKHLNRHDWHNGQHIDHHLGRLHMQMIHPIYCPKEWLVGQAEGRSNISGPMDNDRFWQPNMTDPSTQLFVAVIGLHSSGSSALAGVLYHLGLHLGNQLGGVYGVDPENDECGYEAVGLAAHCETVAPFPSTHFIVAKEAIWSGLRSWINDRRREAGSKRTIAAGKYPMLCRMGNQLLNICSDKLRIIHIDRPFEMSVASLAKRYENVHPLEKIREHQQWLLDGKLELLSRVDSSQMLHVQFDDLVSNTRETVKAICNFLDRWPEPDIIERAIASIKPERKHL